MRWWQDEDLKQIWLDAWAFWRPFYIIVLYVLVVLALYTVLTTIGMML